PDGAESAGSFTVGLCTNGRILPTFILCDSARYTRGAMGPVDRAADQGLPGFLGRVSLPTARPATDRLPERNFPSIKHKTRRLLLLQSATGTSPDEAARYQG